MNEAIETAGLPRPRRNDAGLWKWLCGLLVGALLGTWSGEFVPNRNIVTHDQLNETLQQTVQPLTAAVTALTDEVRTQGSQIQTQNGEISDLKGQLKAQKLISP